MPSLHKICARLWTQCRQQPLSPDPEDQGSLWETSTAAGHRGWGRGRSGGRQKHQILLLFWLLKTNLLMCQCWWWSPLVNSEWPACQGSRTTSRPTTTPEQVLGTQRCEARIWGCGSGGQRTNRKRLNSRFCRTH